MKLGDVQLNSNNLVVFNLDNNSSIDFSKTFNIEEKEYSVTIFNNKKLLVVESLENKIISENEINLFYNISQNFLDIISFYKNETYFISQPESYIIRNIIGGKQKVKVYEILTPKMSANIKFVILDKEGNKIVIKENSSFKSYDFLRYFRMSKGSDYLIDSYKYLFLTFESAFGKVLPEKGGEKNWIKEVFENLNKDYQIDEYFEKDMFNHFYYNQYKKYRNKLFHGKKDIIKPLDYLKMGELYKAYIDLNEICSFVFKNVFNLATSGGFTISEHLAGFMHETLKIGYFNTDLDETIRDVVIKQSNFFKNEMKSVYEFKINGIKDIKFKSVSFLDKDKKEAIISEFDEIIKLNNVSDLSFQITMVFLNKTIHDKKFKDYQLN